MERRGSVGGKLCNRRLSDGSTLGLPSCVCVRVFLREQKKKGELLVCASADADAHVLLHC